MSFAIEARLRQLEKRVFALEQRARGDRSANPQAHPGTTAARKMRRSKPHRDRKPK